jgi:hypothetical protein
MRPVLVELAGQPLRAIAAELQARRIPGPRGPWSGVQVGRTLDRLGIPRDHPAP